LLQCSVHVRESPLYTPLPNTGNTTPSLAQQQQQQWQLILAYAHTYWLMCIPPRLWPYTRPKHCRLFLRTHLQVRAIISSKKVSEHELAAAATTGVWSTNAHVMLVYKKHSLKPFWQECTAGVHRATRRHLPEGAGIAFMTEPVSNNCRQIQ
jgi:hypothetical protein